MKVSNDFPFSSNWENLWKGHSELSQLSEEEEEEDCMRSMFDVAPKERDF